MKKRFLLPAILVAALALSACGSGASTTATTAAGASQAAGETAAGEAATEGAAVNEIVVQVGPSPETIDPALNHAVDGANMIIHAFEGLLKTDKDNKVISGLAESYEVSADGLTYTFKLREGLKWSDGSDLTAEDFVYSWKRMVDPATAAAYAFDTLGSVKGFEEANAGNLDALAVSAPDATTFVVELSAPVAYFHKIVAHATLVPVQQATVEANGEAWTLNPETYITSGPYKMTEFVDGDRIVFEKNEHYWDVANITFDKITYRLIEDANAAYTAYNQGEISMIKTVPSEEIPSLKGNPEFHVDPNMGTYYVSFNTQKAPFDNAKVRQALSLVIDREYVANTIMQGTYIQANTVVGTGISDATEGSKFLDVTLDKYTKGVNSEDYEADVAKAQALLAEAGYPNGEGFPVFEYSTNDAGYHKPVAEYLQSVWAEKLGITMNITIKEWKVFSADRKAGNFDVARQGWVLDWDDPSNLMNLFTTKSGNNDGKISIVAYDELMDKAATATNTEERYAYLHEAEKILIDEAALAPLAFYTDFYLLKSNVKGIWHSPYGYWYFMYGSIE